jgi:hypothetical protein
MSREVYVPFYEGLANVLQEALELFSNDNARG